MKNDILNTLKIDAAPSVTEISHLILFHLVISEELDVFICENTHVEQLHLFCILASHEICRSDPRSGSSKTSRQGNVWVNTWTAIQAPHPGRSGWRWYGVGLDGSPTE